MPTPPRGDPRRPLHLAVSSCRLLGVLGLLATTCAGFGLFMVVSRVRVGPGGRGMAMGSALVALLLFGSVGVGYLVFAHFIKRRRFWAVVAALVVTGLLTLLFLLSLAASVVAAVASAVGPSLASVGVQALILVALGQLIYHLAMSFPALKLAPVDEARGFDVLPIAVMPAAPVFPGPPPTSEGVIDADPAQG